MKKIEKPAFNISTVIKDAISNLSNTGLKEETLLNISTFQDFENDFDSKKQSNEIYLIRRNVTVSDSINYVFLKKLYEDRMLNKNNAARAYYDNIIISSPNGKCSNCNQRETTTLDHYLPKADYPILSVSLLNLIPCCAVCNKDKLINYPTSKEEETIHPYYDDIDFLSWLKCRIIEIKPLKIEFGVRNSVFTGQKLLHDRVCNHFSAFSLNKLYTTHSMEEFSNIKLQLERLFLKGGDNELKEHLYEGYESRINYDINSWQSAFYKCLYESEDFCKGLFI